MAWRVLTPTGAPGALAVFELAGPIESVLSGLGLPDLAVGNVALADVLGVDHGLVVRWSPTVLHVMPHGGPAVVRGLAAALDAAGLARADEPHWPEAQSEVERRMLAALAKAASPRAVELLLDQPRRWSGRSLDEASGAPAALRWLIDPPLVVAVGAANIGKSTLCNALAGRAVSIVADEPGTTRDHVGVMMELDGLVVRYADCPGLLGSFGGAEARESSIDDAVVRAALDLAATADLVLCCGDPLNPPPGAAELGFDPKRLVRVRLRDDLVGTRWSADAAVTIPKTGAARGVDELARTVRHRLVSDEALAWAGPWAFW